MAAGSAIRGGTPKPRVGVGKAAAKGSLETSRGRPALKRAVRLSRDRGSVAASSAPTDRIEPQPARPRSDRTG
jgi:hypothetical protein